MKLVPHSCAAAALAALLCHSSSYAQNAAPQKDTRFPDSVSGKDSPEAAMKKFSVAPGLQVSVWAAEPLLANPVAFSFDESGRAFVAETYRRRSSVPDIRRNEPWTIPNLALRTVEDRVAFLKAQYPGAKPAKDLPDRNGDGQFDWRDLAVESERVKLLIDTDGNGRADAAEVFAEGFNSLETGVGAGVLARHGGVWYTCTPDLWALTAGAPGQAAQKQQLVTGFGVHVAYSGHDTHGLIMGPDGRIYWSVADCGAAVRSIAGEGGKTLHFPDTGAVFRAEPDGTKLEVVMTGLRNPQALAFNDVGDLFTGDNNADGGDAARWVHVVEGGDAGWTIGWQFLPKLGAWNSEKLWGMDIGRTALSLLPPVAHIGHGPAGIAHYPGTGLPEQYADHFFYSDFPGGIRAFRIKQQGASYVFEGDVKSLTDNSAQNLTNKLLWGLYPSDVQFGVDGGVYVLDWIEGWEKTGKGRIYRVHDPALDQSAIVLETKRLLAEGMSGRSVEAIAELLAHADRRVRMAAQFELVRRGDPIPLARATLATNPRLQRLHGIWGVSQLARRNPDAARTLMPLAQDRDAEVRAQWAKFAGEAGVAGEKAQLIRLLEDEEPRVRFFAAQSLGKLGGAEIFEPLTNMLRVNANRDAYLRHAGVVALAREEFTATLAAKHKDEDAAVRTAALLALRRLARPEVALFLTDSSPQIALEAARAIHDVPIPEALPWLASAAFFPGQQEPFSRRAINATYLVGSDVFVASLLAYAAADGPERVRLDVLDAMANWNEPLGRDRVLGIYRPLPSGREAQAAAKALAPLFQPLMEHESESIQLALLEAAAKLKIAEAEAALLATASGEKATGKLRAAALRALAAIESRQLRTALDAALRSNDKTLLAEARRLEAQVSPARVVEQSAAVLEKGSVSEKQSALQTLGNFPGAEADRLLEQWFDRFKAGKLQPELHVDLLEAAAKRKNATLNQKLAAYEKEQAAKAPAARWRIALVGGDAKAGREIFNEKAEAACMRCHKVAGVGGDVGPDMAGIGALHDREHLLRAIVEPNAEIAPGYENVLLTLKNGEFVAGLLKSETTESVTLTSLTDGTPVTVKTADIAQRDTVASPMPPGLGEVLGARGLRDVVEYLASLKEPLKK